MRVPAPVRVEETICFCERVRVVNFAWIRALFSVPDVLGDRIYSFCLLPVEINRGGEMHYAIALPLFIHMVKWQVGVRV